jgi:2-succinyl-5-enolpyruvyl-6-hydroxy-3-cyclohexene-1-carboxylate synthase
MNQYFDWSKGPVHINAPLEPLYETVSELSVPVTVIDQKSHSLSEDEVRVLRFGITQQKIGLSGRE